MKYNWKKIGLYAAGFLLLYVIYKMIDNAMRSTGGGGAGGEGGTVTNTEPAFIYDPSKVSRSKPFGLGSKRSHEVGYLQTWLNLYYDKKLAIDGNFGPKTSASLLSVRPSANIASTTLDSLKV